MSLRKAHLYPLAAAVTVRVAARDQAAKKLGDRQRDLVEEEERLRLLEVRRSVLTQERTLAGLQLFSTDDGLIDVGEIDRRRGAIQFLDQRVKECDLEIGAQEEKARAALALVEVAREGLLEASREVEVLEKHRSEWEKTRRREEREKEEKVLQEISTHRFSSQHNANRISAVEDAEGE